MTTALAQSGFHTVMTGIPYEWIAVTPSNTNYLRGDADANEAAFGLFTPDGGDVEFEQPSGTITMSLPAGCFLPGTFLRVKTGTSATVYAAFLTSEA